MQMRSIFLSNDQLALDIARDTIFADALEFVKHLVDSDAYNVNPEYVTSFLFGGVSTSVKTFLEKSKTATDQEKALSDADNACHFLARTFVAVRNAYHPAGK